MEIEITETSLPGVGRRYDVPTDEGTVVVVVRDVGGAELTIRPTGRGDAATARLDAHQARALAALLAGARYSLVPSDEDADAPGAPGRGERESDTDRDR